MGQGCVVLQIYSARHRASGSFSHRMAGRPIVRGIPLMTSKALIDEKPNDLHQTKRVFILYP